MCVCVCVCARAHAFVCIWLSECPTREKVSDPLEVELEVGELLIMAAEKQA